MKTTSKPGTTPKTGATLRDFLNQLGGKNTPKGGIPQLQPAQGGKPGSIDDALNRLGEGLDRLLDKPLKPVKPGKASAMKLP